ncbi:MAG TPA: tRNA (adenosine(37)-N6)-threonylcarbamoyltransferase complex dimerization subunit type 1 TsaB [Cyclobacteriaceae bacterium]
MALILSLETATSVCSAALHDDGKLLASSEYHVPQSTASMLAVLIDEIFKKTSIEPSQLNAVAVSAGPGSYTGLRIGVATAKGFCYALNIPLIAINTLQLLVHQVASQHLLSDNALLCPMLDARRMEVYTLLSGADLKIIESTEAKVIDELSYQSWLEKNKILFFGNGSDKCKEMIQHENAVFIPDIIPSAAKLGEMAVHKFNSSQFEDLATYEPYYLKDFMVKKPKSIV